MAPPHDRVGEGIVAVLPFFWRFEMLESEFRVRVKNRIQGRFPNLDLDFIDTNAYNFRSMTDLVILGPFVWAALEFKRSENASRQPNQEYHVERLNRKGYASFVSPENLEEVLDDLEELFLS